MEGNIFLLEYFLQRFSTAQWDRGIEGSAEDRNDWKARCLKKTKLRDPCFHTATHNQPQQVQLADPVKIFTDACPKTWTFLGTGCYLFILGLSLRYQLLSLSLKEKTQKNGIFLGTFLHIYPQTCGIEVKHFKLILWADICFQSISPLLNDIFKRICIY